MWTVYADNYGRLWAGTDGGGFTLYHSDSDNFTHFRHNPDDPASLSGNRVRVIYQDRQGAFWIGADGDGLKRFNPEDDSFVHYHGGMLWVGTYKGISRWNYISDAFTHYQTRAYGKPGLGNNLVTGISDSLVPGLFDQLRIHGLGLYGMTRAVSGARLTPIFPPVTTPSKSKGPTMTEF